MKRLIALIMIMFMLAPAAVSADTYTELCGVWTGASEFTYGEVAYFMVHLYEDYTAIYETRSYSIYDTEGYGWVNIGTWKIEKGGVRITYPDPWGTSEEKELFLEFTQAHYLAHKLVNSYVLFVKLPDRRPLDKVHMLDDWD